LNIKHLTQAIACLCLFNATTLIFLSVRLGQLESQVALYQQRELDTQTLTIDRAVRQSVKNLFMGPEPLQ